MHVRLGTFVSCLLLCAAGFAQEFQPPTSGFSDRGTAFPFGSSLNGMRIVVSPGHGWQGDLTGGFQRELFKWTNCGACEGVREDLLNAEICADHLVPMLRQAGARVYVARQIDRQARSVQADDGDASYQEVGPWQQGTSPSLGFQNDYRALHAPKGGSARWTLDIPVEGDYWVQARWAAGANRCRDARFTVSHAGADTDFVVDQRIDGSTWVALGRLRFNAGAARVTLTPPTTGDCHVIADAVRIGGGTDPTSRRPWWQVSALQWQQAAGTPGLGDVSDITVRPALANALGADRFLSFHANAGGGSQASGTSTYRHNCLTDVRWQPLDPAVCDRPAGSAALQYAIQERIVTDLRTGWDPAWKDRGRLVANFGELRVLDGIPGCMVESAYFDGLDTAAGLRYPDNRSLHDPRFRRVMARAIVRGLIAQVAPGAPFPPEPPTHLSLRGEAGALKASWRPSPDALGYRVYVAVDGRGFGNGMVTTSSELSLSDVPTGSVALVRVTALNAGGESTPTEAVAAMASPDGRAARILVINAFDRLDPWVREDHNRRDYSVEHGLALALAGHAFDGASDEAVLAGDLDLDDYRMTDWLMGRESTEHETFSLDAQSRVLEYLAGGGCLVASGSEIAWDLDARGSATDRAFLADALGAAYAADDAGTRQVGPVPGTLFDGMPQIMLADGSQGAYDARSLDVLGPVGSAASVLQYEGGGTAAVARGAASGGAVLLGFPIETIVAVEVRAALMDRLVRFCDAAAPDPQDPDTDGPADSVPDTAEPMPDAIEPPTDAAEPWPDALSDTGPTPPDLDEPPDADATVADAGITWDAGVGADWGPMPDAGTDRTAQADTTPDAHWGRDIAKPPSGDAAPHRPGGGCVAGPAGTSGVPAPPWGLLLAGCLLVAGMLTGRRSGRPERQEPLATPPSPSNRR